MNVTAYPMNYSKAKTKKKLKEIVASNPMNPPIDVQINTRMGTPITPEEMRTLLNITKFVLKGPLPPPMMAKWYAELNYIEEKGWRVK